MYTTNILNEPQVKATALRTAASVVNYLSYCRETNLYGRIERVEQFFSIEDELEFNVRRGLLVTPSIFLRIKNKGGLSKQDRKMLEVEVKHILTPYAIDFINDIESDDEGISNVIEDCMTGSEYKRNHLMNCVVLLDGKKDDPDPSQILWWDSIHYQTLRYYLKESIADCQRNIDLIKKVADRIWGIEWLQGKELQELTAWIEELI